jgi:hypothetical protein
MSNDDNVLRHFIRRLNEEAPLPGVPKEGIAFLAGSADSVFVRTTKSSGTAKFRALAALIVEAEKKGISVIDVFAEASDGFCVTLRR